MTARERQPVFYSNIKIWWQRRAGSGKGREGCQGQTVGGSQLLEVSDGCKQEGLSCLKDSTVVHQADEEDEKAFQREGTASAKEELLKPLAGPALIPDKESIPGTV